MRRARFYILVLGLTLLPQLLAANDLVRWLASQDKLALGSSLQSAGRVGWHRGNLGLPYRVSGRLDVERPGWVITMHAAGTAIRPRRQPAKPAVKTSVRLRSR